MQSDRLTPQSLEAEQCLLGAMIIDPEAALFAVATVSPSEIYREAHRKIFNACAAAMTAEGELDIVIVAEKLKKSDQLEAVGGGVYLAELVDIVPTAANVGRYAAIVKSHAVKRGAILLADRLTEMSYNGNEASDVLDFADLELKQLRAMDRFAGIEGVSMVKDMLSPMMDELEAWQKRGRSWREEFILTDTRIDELLYGLKPKEMSIVKAVRSHGKTAFAVQVADGLIKKKRAVMFISAEMDKASLTWRFVARRTGITIYDRYECQMLPWQWEKLIGAFAAMDKEPLRLYYGGAPEITRIASIMDAELAVAPVDLIVSDYLGKFRHRESDSKERETSYIGNAFKDMAVRYNCHVMLLSQVNEGGDARWSKEVEDAADVVIGIKKETAGASTGTLSVEKHRNGRVGGCGFDWDGRWQNFK